jgi:hypothetical protein
MKTKEEIESFLDRLGAEGAYREVEPGLWVVKPSGPMEFDMVVHYSPPVVVMRVKVMELPKDKAVLAALSLRLLELNASDLLHGSYGVEQDAIVLTEALELAHLDYEEFLASYESMTLALTSHLREIGVIGTTGEHRVPSAARNKASRNGKAKKKAPIKKKKSRTAKAGARRGRR